MKKQAIWFVAVALMMAFVGLLFLQFRYLDEMVSMRREQFDESAKRALFRVSRQLERQETLRYLDECCDDPQQVLLRQFVGDDDVSVSSVSAVTSSSIISSTSVTSSSVSSTVTTTTVASATASSAAPSGTAPSAAAPLSLSPRHGHNTISSRQKVLQDMLRGQYIYQKELLDEVVFRILTRAASRPIMERVNVWQLDTLLRAELQHAGIDLPYELCIIDQGGVLAYRSSAYRPEQAQAAGAFTQVLFPGNTPSATPCYMELYFPGRSRYLLSASLAFMLPSFAFAALMLVLFIFVIVTVLRQKKLSDMKTDFVNNMTHEFKTPISTISLAAQMLGDPAMTKTPSMLSHISDVITAETKRLRMQVDKVLLMSMFDRQKAQLRLRDASVHALVSSVVQTFALKVERSGGSIQTSLDASADTCALDEMHFTNILFNLLDNAYKYARDGVPLQLHLATRNPDPRHLELTVRDNGIGIRREDLGKIFERFYRVSTGNLHNVKGFGLGLSYVQKIVHDHNGTIRAESELGQGSAFILTLPLVKVPPAQADRATSAQ